MSGKQKASIHSRSDETENAEELLADTEVVAVKEQPSNLATLREEAEGEVDGAHAGAGAGALGEEEDDDEGELAEEDVHDEEGNDRGEDDDGLSTTSTAIPSGPDISRLQLTGHTDSIYCVAVSHNGLMVGTGSGDDTARLWSLQSNPEEKPAPSDVGSPASASLVFTLKGHKESINVCAFNASDSLFATGALDGEIRIWSTATGALVAALDGPGSDVSFLSWHPKGDVLVAGSADTTVWMWSISEKTGRAEVMQVFAGHEGEVTTGCWSSSGKTLLSGDTTGAVRMWNPKTGATQQLFAGKDWHEAAVNCIDVAASPDKPLMASASEDGSAKLVNCATGKTVLTLNHAWNGGSKGSAPGSSSGSTAAAGAGDSAEEEEEQQQASVECVALSDDEALLATGCSDGSLTIFDVGAGGGGGGAVRHLLRHPDTVISLRWISRALNHYHSPPASSSSSPSDGTAQNLSADTVSMLKRQWAGKLAASCADGAVYLWDARDGKLVQRLTGHCGMIIDVQVAFTAAAAPFNAASSASNPLRPIVVTAGDDGVSRVFEIG